MSAVSVSENQVERLRRAARTLDDPPVEPAWNALDADVLRADDAPRRAAAVLVPFVRHVDDLTVLFTQRTAHLRQHAGQISFPGGGIDAGDADAVAAALRETDEETGIAPAFVEPFGFLDCLDTVSGFCVTPVMGFVAPDYSLRLHAHEVDDVFEVPLSFILDPGQLRRERMHWRGRDRDIHVIEWQGRRIWGVTAAILRNLLDRLGEH